MARAKDQDDVKMNMARAKDQDDVKWTWQGLKIKMM
jgi:hypothetical protein